MTKPGTFKLMALAAALAISGFAHAEDINLSGQYTLHTSVAQDSAHQYTFTYIVDNVAQGYANTRTGLDGFTIYIPTGATVISASEPASYIPGQGVWTKGVAPSLDLSYGGSTSQNMSKPGYNVYTFWGQDTGSVFPIGQSATFSITLGNVSLGSNTVGISSYYGGSAVPDGQDYVHNTYGNYTTFTTTVEKSAVAAVPEPETYAMMLAGLGAVGFIARRRRKA